MGDATVEACQQEVALGKQWWRLAMWHTQHWVVQRGNNRHLSHVAAPQDRWEIKYWMWKKPSPSLSLTGGIQSFPSTIDEWVVGPLLQKSEEGILWHTQLTCTRSFTYWNASIMWHEQDHNFGSCWSDGEGWEDETNVICLQIYVVTWLSHSHVTMESRKIMGNKQLVHLKIRYYICK